MTIEIKEICRYPVKGLAADTLDTIDLEMGECLPYDRKWGIIHAASKIDPAAPRWVGKSNFLMLARDEKLGQLGASFDADSKVLTITRKGRPVSKGNLSDPMGRSILQTFLAGFMPTGPRGNPRIVEAPGKISFSDVSERVVSIINLASLRDLETRVIRQPVHPHRFRGNFYIDGTPAWSELDWVGKKLKIGSATLEVVDPIGRCTATNVNPETGTADMNIPLNLQRAFSHSNCGVYAQVVEDGTVTAGDTLELL